MPRNVPRVFVGFDAAEMVACNVAMTSLFQHTSRDAIRVERLSRLSLWGRYTRETTRMPSGQLYDELSDAPMSTDHAIARFFVPLLMEYSGWALFTDGDVLFRDDIRQLFALADPAYAVQVVQHAPILDEAPKKDGQIQQAYPRKNWSSVILWNCGHPANRALTLDVLNTWPGRDLHAFRWLSDAQIGALPARWNVLIGEHEPPPDTAIAHYTLGVPNIPGHELDAFAYEWWTAARVAGYRFAFPEQVAV